MKEHADKKGTVIVKRPNSQLYLRGATKFKDPARLDLLQQLEKDLFKHPDKNSTLKIGKHRKSNSLPTTDKQLNLSHHPPS
jgi:hypothetical protein